jgi:hypothetical protein
VQSIVVSPMNSLLFISDANGGSPPEPVRGPMILSTSSCISVRCLPEPDGPTEIVFGDSNEVAPGAPPAFDGELETPDNAVVVSTVDLQTLLETRVPDNRTRIRIWLSHRQWPDKIIIGLN